jgi:threonine dehydratase
MNIISSCYFFEKGIQAMQTPNFHDVLEARRRIRPYLARTPMYSYPAINELIGTDVYINDDWTPANPHSAVSI